MKLAWICLAAALATAACSGEPEQPAVREGSSVQEGTSTVESGAPCVPTPVTAAPLPAAFPQRLALPAGSEQIGVERRGEVDLLTWRVPGSAAQVLTHFRDAAEPAGFAVVRDEDEGRTGKLQLFGASSTIDITVASLTCPRGSAAFTLQLPSPSG